MWDFFNEHLKKKKKSYSKWHQTNFSFALLKCQNYFCWVPLDTKSRYHIWVIVGVSVFKLVVTCWQTAAADDWWIPILFSYKQILKLFYTLFINDNPVVLFIVVSCPALHHIHTRGVEKKSKHIKKYFEIFESHFQRQLKNSIILWRTPISIMLEMQTSKSIISQRSEGFEEWASIQLHTVQDLQYYMEGKTNKQKKNLHLFQKQSGPIPYQVLW